MMATRRNAGTGSGLQVGSFFQTAHPLVGIEQFHFRHISLLTSSQQLKNLASFCRSNLNQPTPDAPHIHPTNCAPPAARPAVNPSEPDRPVHRPRVCVPYLLVGKR